MNIQEEKEFIYGMMKDISSERRKLTDIYYQLKERLDELFRLEKQGIEELSLKGYLDYHNKIKTESIVRNIKRESEFIINNIEEKNSQEEKEEIIPKQIIIEEQVKEEKRNRRGKGYLNVSQVIDNIIVILKEEGIPLHINKILEKLNEKELPVEKKNLNNNILPKAVKNNKIEKIGRGVYQYKRREN